MLALIILFAILGGCLGQAPPKKKAAQKKPCKAKVNPQTLEALREAMQDQIDAECEIAIAQNRILNARDKQAELHAKQQLQRAKLAKQAANAYAKAARLQAQIDKMQMQEETR